MGPRAATRRASRRRARLKVAQKVGEEGVELALAAAAQNKDRVVDEAADLLYHVLLLLKMRELKLADVVSELEGRHGGSRTAESPLA